MYHLNNAQCHWLLIDRSGGFHANHEESPGASWGGNNFILIDQKYWQFTLARPRSLLESFLVFTILFCGSFAPEMHFSSKSRKEATWKCIFLQREYWHFYAWAGIIDLISIWWFLSQDADIEEMFAFADTDGDGSLSFQEFEVTVFYMWRKRDGRWKSYLHYLELLVFSNDSIFKDSGDGIFWMNTSYHKNRSCLENGETHRAAGRVETAHIWYWNATTGPWKCCFRNHCHHHHC